VFPEIGLTTNRMLRCAINLFDFEDAIALVFDYRKAYQNYFYQYFKYPELFGEEFVQLCTSE
jgi:hypothetical protein